MLLASQCQFDYKDNDDDNNNNDYNDNDNDDNDDYDNGYGDNIDNKQENCDAPGSDWTSGTCSSVFGGFKVP